MSIFVGAVVSEKKLQPQDWLPLTIRPASSTTSSMGIQETIQTGQLTPGSVLKTRTHRAPPEPGASRLASPATLPYTLLVILPTIDSRLNLFINLTQMNSPLRVLLICH